MKKKIKKKNCKNVFRENAGYTIVETMIAVSIFTIIATAGMTALLQANVVHQKSQDMRSIMDNLNFIMEETARNIRTGYNYRCITGALPPGTLPSVDVAQSCSSGGAIAFEYAFGDDADSSDQWVYKVEGSGGSYSIWKSVNSGAAWTKLNPPEVVLSSASGFTVIGAEAPPGNTQQPMTIIKLVGTITYKNVVSPFSLETAVSQRLVDI
jgi:prepilin-type N-terminal cleavage/methylation domain-containing protein